MLCSNTGPSRRRLLRVYSLAAAAASSSCGSYSSRCIESGGSVGQEEKVRWWWYSGGGALKQTHAIAEGERTSSSSAAFLWNALIRSSSNNNNNNNNNPHFGRRIILIYNAMVCAGVSPDHHTFPLVLKACAAADCHRITSRRIKGMEVHSSALKLGFASSDLFVANTLILFYGSIGDLSSAHSVFRLMPLPDIVSWNSILRASSLNGNRLGAFNLFTQMMTMNNNIMPNTVTLLTLLPIISASAAGPTTQMIHCYAVKVGFYPHTTTISNALLHTYGKSAADFNSMMRVFTEMMMGGGEINQVSYNATITSFANTNQYDRLKDAVQMFRQMMDVSGLTPNSVTASSIIPVLVQLDCFLAGKELHAFCLRSGIVSDIFVSNSLIHMYAKFGYSKEASVIFHSIKLRNAVSWNAMIANFSQNNLELEAVGLVRQMQAHGEVPNSITFTNILPACARIGLLRVGKEIHSWSVRTGAAFDLFVSNALIDMYAKCRCLKLAQNVFDISLRDEISYTTLIMGYSQTSDCLKSLNLFLEMRSMTMTHDTVCFVGVLSACANQGAIKQGKEIHGFLVRKLLHTHLYIANSLVDLYSKCGQIELSRRIFDGIPNKDVASWNTMILGYGLLGETEIAINLFEDMRRNNGLEHDSISYIAILSACSHGGLVDKGRKYFDEMGAKKIKPMQTHYACMVDLLGRAGLIEEAADLIRGLTIKPDSNIWGAMLGACRIYGNVEMGCWAAEHLLELNPDHSGYYALLSNTYAEAGRWDDSHYIRELMKSREVKKNPGRSWA